MSTSRNLDGLQDALRDFAAQRNWKQFHSPKNLASALIVEAAELLEHFQWLESGSPEELGAERFSQVRHEMADVLLYLVQLADRLGIDLLAAAEEKMKINAVKYPPAGSAG